ncbi:MAG: radical SAM protein [Candidatus Omnitrophica bacterium]|nr:radical SAM protein [Candidatus Omnitrophota bacterium]MDD5591932.1 radical SAM protein [Candidatus Omnitrophota bacterium]
MKKRIGFIVPNTDKQVRYGKLSKLGSYLPSLGIAYISAVVEKEGYEVSIIDAEVNNYSDEEVMKEVSRLHPGVIGFQTFYNTIDSCFRLANRIKAYNKDIIIVFGGIQSTLFPEETLNNHYVDYVVMGEGEIIFKNLLKHIYSAEEANKIKGLVYRDNNKIIKNPREENIMDLDSLPLPARHLFPMDLYRSSGNLRGKRNLHIMSSRGCPFSCAFCESHMTFGKTNRFHGTDRVIQELIILRDIHGADAIQFYDESFTLNKERVYNLCDQMRKRKINLPWSCFTRVNLIDLDLLKAMKAAGCYQIFFGVESGVPRLLKLINKLHTLEQVKKAFELTNRVRIQSTASFILGLPTETSEEASQTIAFAKEIKPTFANFLLFCPFPGTDIYDISLKNGNILEKDTSKWSNFNENQIVYLTHGREKKDILQSVKKGYREFYLRPQYFWNVLPLFNKDDWWKFLKICSSAYKLLLPN